MSLTCDQQNYYFASAIAKFKKLATRAKLTAKFANDKNSSNVKRVFQTIVCTDSYRSTHTLQC